MPTYHYRCKQCQATQTIFHGMMEDPYQACLDCGGLTERVLAGAPTILSGAPESAELVTDASETDAHDCASGCVLHRKPQMQTKPL